MLSEAKHNLKTIYRLLKRMAHPLPLYSERAKLSCIPFFIITAGRSGSTLLRAMIVQDPTVCIPPESHVLGPVIRKFKLCYKVLPWKEAVRLVISEFQTLPGFRFWEMDLVSFYQVAFDIPEDQWSLAKLLDTFYLYYAQAKKPQATRWGDKSIRNAFCLPQIDQVFPEAKYIHLIRDGRDAVASYLAHRIISPELECAADYWLRSVEQGCRFGARLDATRYLEIFYEALGRGPEPVIRKVYDFLRLDYKPEVLQFWQNVTVLGDTNRALHQNLGKPVHEDSIGKWRKQLSPEEQAILQNKLKPKLLELNYPVD